MKCGPAPRDDVRTDGSAAAAADVGIIASTIVVERVERGRAVQRDNRDGAFARDEDGGVAHSVTIAPDRAVPLERERHRGRMDVDDVVDVLGTSPAIAIATGIERREAVENRSDRDRRAPPW
jgi:hypothetical protein